MVLRTENSYHFCDVMVSEYSCSGSVPPLEIEVCCVPGTEFPVHFNQNVTKFGCTETAPAVNGMIQCFDSELCYCNVGAAVEFWILL